MAELEFVYQDWHLAAERSPDLAMLDIDVLRQRFDVFMDMRIDGESVFYSDARSIAAGRSTGYYVKLLDFALTVSYAVHETIATVQSDIDPYESGIVLDLTLERESIVIFSRDLNRAFRLSPSDATAGVHRLNERVRALLIGISDRFREHPQLGPWVRGETEFVEY